MCNACVYGSRPGPRNGATRDAGSLRGVHPVERLRSVSRWAVDDDALAAEAAEALAAFSFDAAGRFSQIIIGDAQPAMKTPDPRKPDAPVVAYYGNYTVNEGAKTIAVKVDAGSYSPRAGSELTWTVEIKGDTLSLVGSPRKDQEGTYTPRVELKRAK